MNQPWIYMCSPSWSPLPPPSPSDPSGSSQCTSPGHLSHASNLGWWSVSPLIVYMFQCYSFRISHPCLLPQSMDSSWWGIWQAFLAWSPWHRKRPCPHTVPSRMCWTSTFSCLIHPPGPFDSFKWINSHQFAEIDFLPFTLQNPLWGWSKWNWFPLTLLPTQGLFAHSRW